MNNHTRGVGLNKQYVEASELTFANYGCILVNIPKELFNKLKTEADHAIQQNKTMISGLTGNGVPKHFNLKDDHRQELDAFVMTMVKKYFDAFELYKRSFRCLTDNTQLVCGTPWFNFQEKYEFVPLHIHDGVLSYSAWINIPYDRQDEHTHGKEFAGCFQFSCQTITGQWSSQEIFIDKSYEGKLMIFPSSLPHCVYPFYSSNDYRISLSGNVLFDTHNSRVEGST
jgi:hypothetical protein